MAEDTTPPGTGPCDAELARLRAVAAGGAREVRRAIDGAVSAERERITALFGDPDGERTPGAETGAAMIRAERARQVTAEGYTPDHDAGHDHGELARAAACYALPPEHRPARSVRADSSRGDRYSRVPVGWPWHPDAWKPGDRLAELVKAGALIAAELDRLTGHG
jgi:hypothetical protein